MKEVRVAIVGATGLVGESLIRVLLGHPQCRFSVLVSEHAGGRSLGEIIPSLRGECDLATVHTVTPREVAAVSDLVFTARKGKDSFLWVPPLLEGGARVIDMGAEFRFKDAGIYEAWYHSAHECKDLLKNSAFGLPELFRDEIARSPLIGNPGCYVTSAVLALAPFVVGDLIEPLGIVVDSFSGLSGAGRQFLPNRSNLFIDIDSNLRAYSPGSHRHNPEIDMALSAFAGKPWKVTFVPHLAPMVRGILTTLYARPRAGSFSSGEAFEVLRSFYRDRGASFVRVLNKVEEVAVSNVERSNYCDLAAEYVARTGQLVIASALDNLVKGAAGQAVQNMNILFGLDETIGLKGRSL